MNFTNKKVLVTGGSRGIGKEIVRAFAEAGAQVAIHFRETKLEATVLQKSLPGSGHIVVQGDISKSNDCQKIVETTIAHFGKLDVLVNNAGVLIPHSVNQVGFEEWNTTIDHIFQVNVLGPARLIHQVTAHMIRQGGGRIVNVSSRGAFRGEPNQPAYGASKAALNAFGQSLAQKLAPYNIFIATVAPGFVQTDMARDVLQGESGKAIRNQSPLGRIARPEEVAKGVLFLASEGTDFMTGSILDINGASYLRS